MKFRKFPNPNSKQQGYILQVQDGADWKTVRKNSALYNTFLSATGQNEIDPRDAKPFAPKSYRDFMLSEAHYINAASNYAKTARPVAYRITQIYKKLTGKTHPKLRPAPLWYEQPIFYMGGHMNFYGDGAEII